MASALLRQGAYRFELQVHDGELYSNVVGIDIAVVNVAPVAVVGDHPLRSARAVRSTSPWMARVV